MKIVKYQLDKYGKQQTLHLPVDCEILCVKWAYVDGGMYPCLYAMCNPDTLESEEVVLMFINEGEHVPEKGVEYVGEYVSGRSVSLPHQEHYCFVFIQHHVPSVVV